jgi:beta-galactosidase
VPGPWLHAGANQVIVFDLLAPEQPTLQGLDHPILNDLRPDDRSH